MNNRNKIKRIGIDARFYGPVGKGLGRYTQEIVDNIINLDKENEYVIFLGEENYDDFLCDGERVKKVLTPVRWYGFAEQILMPFYIWRERLDLVHFPHFNIPVFCPTKFVITIHDLILTKFPTTRATTLGPALYKIKNFFYKIVIWLGVKRAERIFAVSKFTKDDIVKHFKVSPRKVAVTYEGVADLGNTRSGQQESGYRQELGYRIPNREYDTLASNPKPFLLYVGNAYPHKNLEGLIRVFNKTIKQESNKTSKQISSTARARANAGANNRSSLSNLRLILVGKEDYFYKRIKDYAAKLGLWKAGNENSAVIFPGYVPDAELKILYQNALAYVFPSLYEGFGLPPLEAMSQGCPVASSNKASMPEILGEAAIFFNPEDEKETQAQIERIIKDENLRQKLIKKGYKQVKKYNWQECARRTLGVYEEVIRKSKNFYRPLGRVLRL
jgi:glycosyltransferase involved in cell wall biosynthesis